MNQALQVQAPELKSAEMNGPVTALLWELFRTSRFELVIRLAAQCALIGAVGTVADGLAKEQVGAVRGVCVALVLFGSLFAQTWLGEFDSRSPGFSFRLAFVRPVRTSILVGVPLVFCAVTSFLIFLASVILLGVMLDSPVPLLAPACAIAVLVAAAVCITWSLPHRGEKALGMSALVALTIWLIRRLMTPQAEPEPLLLRFGSADFFDWQWPHVLAAAAVPLVLIPLCVLSVDRQRHGETVSLRNLWPQWRSSCTSDTGYDASPLELQPFSSRLAAQFWYEWRNFGKTVVLVGLVAALALAFTTIAVVLISDRLKFEPRIWLGVLLASPVVLQFIAADGALGLTRVQGSAGMSIFDAVRPLTNDQMVAVKLLMMAAASVCGWSCILLAAAATTGACSAWQDWIPVLGHIADAYRRVPWYWQAAGLANLLLMFGSQSAILLGFGIWVQRHHRALMTFVVLSILQLLLVEWDYKRGWPWRLVWIAEAWSISAIVTVGSLWLLYTALKTRSLNRSFFGVVSSFWLVYLASCVSVWRNIPEQLRDAVPTFVAIPLMSLLLVPLVSAAIAPLAIGDARHG